MAIQKEVDLNEPLNADADPTLSVTRLTPDLSHAAITIHGDFYRQLQMRLNRHVFWHPISTVVYATVISSVLIVRLWDYIVISDSIGEFLYFAVKSRDFIFQILTIFPVMIFVVGTFGLVNWLASDHLRDISDDLVKKDYISQIFGFDIKKYRKLEVDAKANSSQDVSLLSNGENSSIIMYRDTPIAIITLVVSGDEIKVTGLHVKKVFRKADFEGLLLDWAIDRSRQILKESGEEKITLLVNSCTFDNPLVDTLKYRHFSLVDSSLNLNPFIEDKSNFFLNLFEKVFGVRREIYGLTLTEDAEEEVIKQAASKLTKRA